MRRFTASLPDGGRIAYGIDPSLGGFWGEVKRPGKRLVEYDALHPGEFDFKRPLEGLLFFWVRQGVFSEEELHDALLHLEEPTSLRLSAGVKLAIEIVTSLKMAAAS